MWIDQCVPTVLNYSGSVVNYVSTGTFYQIQALGNGATVKALTSAGTVYGTTDVYSTSTGITMLPGERWEGKFLSVALYGGDVVLHELPGGNEEIVSYGAGTAYATVNDLPDYVADRKLTIMDRSTGTKTACCWVFHNEGEDSLNAGRPANLVNLLNPSNAFKIKFNLYIKRTVSVAQYAIAFNDADLPATHQISLFFRQTNNTVNLRIGATGGLTASYTLPVESSWLTVEIISNGTTTSLYINGALIGSLTSGTYQSTSNLILAGGYTIEAYNAEADFLYYAFYDGAGALVDCYDFADPTKWNGGSTMVSCAGNTATFTDGTPIGIRKKAAIPRNLLAY